jgi:hypothetical protein
MWSINKTNADVFLCNLTDFHNKFIEGGSGTVSANAATRWRKIRRRLSFSVHFGAASSGQGIAQARGTAGNKLK